MKENHYSRLLVMTGISFVAMYILMYAMVDSFDGVYNSLNQVYMAGLMAAPMVPIELALMRGMYHDRRMNAVFLAGALVVGAVCLLAIRQQAAIDDRQFLRSMIPHHSGAVLMCREAPVADPRIQSLCTQIIESQRSEIALMRALLDE
jgi:uncharacterized protein (DUF305 family)